MTTRFREMKNLGDSSSSMNFDPDGKNGSSVKEKIDWYCNTVEVINLCLRHTKHLIHLAIVLEEIPGYLVTPANGSNVKQSLPSGENGQ